VTARPPGQLGGFSFHCDVLVLRWHAGVKVKVAAALRWTKFARGPKMFGLKSAAAAFGKCTTLQTSMPTGWHNCASSKQSSGKSARNRYLTADYLH